VFEDDQGFVVVPDKQLTGRQAAIAFDLNRISRWPLHRARIDCLKAPDLLFVGRIDENKAGDAVRGRAGEAPEQQASGRMPYEDVGRLNVRRPKEIVEVLDLFIGALTLGTCGIVIDCALT
jgi:hypothetical protein